MRRILDWLLTSQDNFVANEAQKAGYWAGSSVKASSSAESLKRIGLSVYKTFAVEVPFPGHLLVLKIIHALLKSAFT
jgi:hypothetical protein